MTEPRKSTSAPVVVGRVRAQPMPLTVQREPEVGIAWEACVVDLGRCALGATPREAIENLLGHLDWLEVESLDDAALHRLDPIGER